MYFRPEDSPVRPKLVAVVIIDIKFDVLFILCLSKLTTLEIWIT